MIPQLRPCQRQHRRRKEHSLIIGMRNQQTYPLIVQTRKRAGERRGRGRREAPENDDGGDGEAYCEQFR